MRFDNYKFRASGVGHIMTNLSSITDNQLERLSYLEGRPSPTDKQLSEIEHLKAKRDAPDSLPPGALTHLQDIYNSVVYGIRDVLSNKFLEKGNLQEQDSLDLLSKVSGKFLSKNDKSFENNYVKGTPDAIIGDYVIDTKTNWGKRNFDTADFPNQYYWQLVTYMWLTGAKFGLLAYCLVNTPEHLILDEIRRAMWREGVTDDQSDEGLELEQAIRMCHEFNNIEAKNKVRLFYADRNEGDINHLKRRVEMARKHLSSIFDNEKSYKPEIRF